MSFQLLILQKPYTTANIDAAERIRLRLREKGVKVSFEFTKAAGKPIAKTIIDLTKLCPSALEAICPQIESIINEEEKRIS